MFLLFVYFHSPLKRLRPLSNCAPKIDTDFVIMIYWRINDLGQIQEGKEKGKNNFNPLRLKDFRNTAAHLITVRATSSH